MASTDFRRLVENWRSAPSFEGDLVHVRVLPAREARCEDLDPPLSGPLTERLAGKGVTRLYSHQARAVRLIRNGEHVVLVSGTASGKTLCYQIPIAERILEDPARTALLMFPTKALAQDQLRSLRRLDVPGLAASTYDGDLPAEQRPRIRKKANVILTNPDMLHYGILPHHGLWGSFLSRLDYVVIDEIHYLRGMFGSHTAQIVRRLRRLAAHYGARPTFVLTSATIGNPAELAARLTGLEVSLVEGNGAPTGERVTALWNPPLEDEAQGSRRSPLFDTTDLYVDLVRRGTHTIVFGRSRKTAELLHIYSTRRLGPLADRIAPYRAGYTANDRRRTEQRLFSGELLGITATNALELGIDVGGLDAALLCTFPGTVSSYRQQAGRAGRSRDMSLVVLVAGEDALDQYFMHHPDELFDRPPEAAVVNPDNPSVLDGHLSCAAHELPLTHSDRKYFGEGLEEAAPRLVGGGDLRQEGSRLHWTGHRSPARRISLRSSSNRSFVLYDLDTRRRMGELEWERAFSDAHEGAVYLHMGRTYLIHRIDLRRAEILARRTEVSYYTEPSIDKDLSVLDVEKDGRLGSGGPLPGMGEGVLAGGGVPPEVPEGRPGEQAGQPARSAAGGDRNPGLLVHVARRDVGAGGPRPPQRPGRPPRRRTHHDRHDAAVRHLRPLRHRGPVHRIPSRHRRGGLLHPRRLPGRGGHRPRRLPGGQGPDGGHHRDPSPLPLRSGMPFLRPVPQMRQLQRAPLQTRGPPAAGDSGEGLVTARRTRSRRRALRTARRPTGGCSPPTR